jgi:hypothetical protein
MPNTTQNGRQTLPNVANTMQNAKRPCQNVANTMQNDWFQFKTVAKTRQMVLGKKANKKIQNLRQEKSKNYSTPDRGNYSPNMLVFRLANYCYYYLSRIIANCKLLYIMHVYDIYI